MVQVMLMYPLQPQLQLLMMDVEVMDVEVVLRMHVQTVSLQYVVLVIEVRT